MDELSLREFRVVHGRHPMREPTEGGEEGDDLEPLPMCAVLTTNERSPPVPPRIATLSRDVGSLLQPPSMPVLDVPPDLRAAMNRAEDTLLNKFDNLQNLPAPSTTAARTLLTNPRATEQQTERINQFLTERYTSDEAWREQLRNRQLERDLGILPTPPPERRHSPPIESINYARPRSLLRINRINETMGYARGTPWRRRMDEWWSRWARQWRTHASRPPSPREPNEEKVPLTRRQQQEDILQAAHKWACCQSWVFKCTLVGIVVLIALLVLGPVLGHLVWPTTILDKIRSGVGEAGKALKDLTSDSDFDFDALHKDMERLNAIREENWTGLHEILEIPTPAPKSEPVLQDPLQSLIETFQNNIRSSTSRTPAGTTPGKYCDTSAG